MSEQQPAPSCQRKPEIDYPCLWVYKVIGEDPAVLREIIITACAPAAVEISPSHQSSKGKYHSLNASLTVDSEEMRHGIYELLKNHPAVKIVL